MNGDLYIDPKFSAVQDWIWTSDTVSGSSGRAWVVGFYSAVVTGYNVDHSSYHHVRPVRSVK